MTHSTKILLVLAATSVPACATNTPTRELVQAREAYTVAQHGQAIQYAPDRVHVAKLALDRAESEHAANPGSISEKRMAYAADRQARIAEQIGAQKAAEAKLIEAKARHETVLSSQRDSALSELASTEDQLQKKQGELGTAKEQLTGSHRRLEQEQLARQEAQRQTAAALESLKQIAAVKEEQNRTTITLSGAVLFKPSSASLLPIARTSLDQVAKAIKEQGEDKMIVIAGHTDSRGKPDFNQRLSQDRAEAVRVHLISQGVPADRVVAVGKGEDEPVADNTSTEGRANNRRVEIIIGEEAQGRTSGTVKR